MIPSKVDLRKLTTTRRMIYLLVAVVVVVPYLVHLPPISLEPTKDAKKLYNQIDALKPGSHVLLSFDYSPSAQAELYPMSQAVMRHCFRNGLIPIIMTHDPQGLDLAKEICENCAAENWETVSKVLKGCSFPCKKQELVQQARKAKASAGVLYVLEQLDDRSYASLEDVHQETQARRLPEKEPLSGRDWVYLGYKTGYQMVLISMGENLKATFEKDFYDQPTAVMPALQGINSLKNMKFVMEFTASGLISGMWIPYGSDRYGFPLGVGTTAVQAPNLVPFLDSGQLVGYLGGLRGAADYEVLLHRHGDGLLGMYAQSAAHILMIVLIVGANIRMLAGRRKARNK